MDFKDLTLGDLSSIRTWLRGSEPPLPFKVGEKWLFRCVTNYIVGEISEVCGAFLVLRNASWVADTGRFSEAMSTGKLNEVEHQESRCVINTGALVDAFEWSHKLPETTK